MLDKWFEEQLSQTDIPELIKQGIQNKINKKEDILVFIQSKQSDILEKLNLT